MAYLPYINYDLLEAFHCAQIENELGIDAHLGNLFEEEKGDVKGSFVSLMRCMNKNADFAVKVNSIMMSHRTRFKSPPNSSHEKTLEKIIHTPPFEGVWNKILERLRRDKVNPSNFIQFFLNCTFMASYEAAHQLFNSQEYLKAASKIGPGIKATSDFKFQFVPDLPAAGDLSIPLIFSVENFYTSSFPFLEDREVSLLLVRNPLFIYLELVRIEGTHEIEGRTALDDGDSWDE